jgi:hypothetical protein
MLIVGYKHPSKIANTIATKKNTINLDQSLNAATCIYPDWGPTKIAICWEVDGLQFSRHKRGRRRRVADRAQSRWTYQLLLWTTPKEEVPAEIQGKIASKESNY